MWNMLSFLFCFSHTSKYWYHHKTKSSIHSLSIVCRHLDQSIRYHQQTICIVWKSKWECALVSFCWRKVTHSSFMTAGECSTQRCSHLRLNPDLCPSLTRLHCQLRPTSLFRTSSHWWLEKWNFNCRTAQSHLRVVSIFKLADFSHLIHLTCPPVVVFLIYVFLFS